MRSFNYTSACTDLYYFTGVYNYYRDAYPRIYPVYKPLAMLFPSGDEKTGLEQLNISAVNSIVLRAESLYLLVYIYTNFENDYRKSLGYAKTLYELYPNNTEFTASYLRNLLLLKNYDEAIRIIDSVREISAGRFFQAQISIFRGIIQEKRYHDNASASQYYNRGISEISHFGSYGNEYAAYGYFGLSRICEANGDKRESQMYHREAMKLADFEKVDFD
jgi:tetratricopeptide (TPR) repeat protein